MSFSFHFYVGKLFVNKVAEICILPVIPTICGRTQREEFVANRLLDLAK